MKIIDLLNKIANGEEVPKKIKVDNRFYYEYDENIDYKSKDGTYLFDTYIQINKEDMNMEVEIIEEDKKIEKLDSLNTDYYAKEVYYERLSKEEITLDIQTLKNKTNEIIDSINNINIILSPSEIAIDKCKKIDYLMENKQ